MAYEDIRNPDLPWGYWLTIHRVSGLVGPIIDEDGVGWESVREAFWRGRMRMPPGDANDLDEQLDHLAAALTAYHRRTASSGEARRDIFDGGRMFQRFYVGWLYGHGLTSTGSRGTVLTPEGRAVLLMLTATRPTQLGPLPVGPDAAPPIPASHVRSDHREAWYAEIARFGARLPCRFERAVIGSNFVILLVGDGFGRRMPMRRVLWSQAFAEEDACDRLFHWLAVRLDRWGDWGQRAWNDGAPAFTQFLLELMATALLGQEGEETTALLGGPLLRRD